MGNTFSSGKVAIAICGRCSMKYPYRELSSDPNVPGLRVCHECKDQLDPYRLPARQPDAFVLRNPRPDTPLTDFPNYILNDDGFYINADTGEPLDIPEP